MHYNRDLRNVRSTTCVATVKSYTYRRLTNGWDEDAEAPPIAPAIRPSFARDVTHAASLTAR